MIKKIHYLTAISLAVIVCLIVIFQFRLADDQQINIDFSDSAIHFDELELGGQKLNIKPIRVIKKAPIVELSEPDKQDIFSFTSSAIKNFLIIDDEEKPYNHQTQVFLSKIYNKFNHSDVETFDGVTLQEIKSTVMDQLAPKVAERLIELINGYVAYRDAEKAIRPVDPQGREVLKFYEQVLQLRRVYLGLQVANTLFSKEEAFSRYAIQVRFLNSEQALSENEKQQHAANLQTAFLAEFSQVIPKSAMQKMQLKADELKVEGASELDIFQFYVNSVGKVLGKSQLSFN